MADAKISELPAATTPLAGTELMEIVQGGVNKQVATSEVGGGGAVDSVNGQIGVVVLDAGDVGADPSGSAATVAGNLAAHIADTTDAHAGTAITNTAAGNIAATTVQGAINELDGDKLAKLITIRQVIATHELDATDLASVNAGVQLEIYLNSASPLTLEIPTNAVRAFPIGSVVGGIQYGVGQVTIAPDATVTMRSPNNANKTFAQNSKFYITKISTDDWLLSGDITV